MIILNEKEYCENVLRTGELGDKPFQTLSLLAKYYYHHLGYRRSRISKCLYTIMEQCYPRFNIMKVKIADACESIAAKAGKYPLYEIDGIWITQSELDIIDQLKDEKMQRVLFTLLCLAKLGNAKREKNNGWVNVETREIFNLARVSCRVPDRDFMLGKLGKMGLLEFPKKNDNISNRVTFINDASEKVLKVNDFRELGYEYKKFKGHNYIRCRECGILIRGNKNGTKQYCSACAGYIPLKTKTITCIDCGKEIRVSSMNNRSIRCVDCQKLYRNDYMREEMRKLRNNDILLSKQLKDETSVNPQSMGKI